MELSDTQEQVGDACGARVEAGKGALGGGGGGVGGEDVVETGEEVAVVVWRVGGWEGSGRVVALCGCHGGQG